MGLKELGIDCATVQTLFLLISVLAGLTALIFTALFALRGIAIHDISTACNLKNPWYGFLPFFQAYSLGQIADLYRDKNNRRSRFSAQILLALSVIGAIATLVGLWMVGNAGIQLAFRADAVISTGGTVVPADQVREFMKSAVIGVCLLCCNVIYYIAYQICLWRVYRILDHYRAAIYWIIGLILPILIPVFLYALRNKSPILSYAERMGSQTEFRFGE